MKTGNQSVKKGDIATAVYQICEPKDCDNYPFTTHVKNRLMSSCCQKGFQKSLSDFQGHLKALPITHHT